MLLNIRINKKSFGEYLKKFGIDKQISPSKDKLILSSKESGRDSRRQTLKQITFDLKKNNMPGKWIDDQRSGYIFLKNGLKIFLKPEKSASGIILKPSFFGDFSSSLVEKWIPYRRYFPMVLKSIEKTKQLSTLEKNLLETLCKYVKTGSSKDLNEFQKTTKIMEKSSILNTINDDFGEVLGPFAIFSKNLIPIDEGSAEIFYPRRPNEPLLDYHIRDKKREYKISAKSGKTTNTLKPTDILMLIQKSKSHLSKHKNTQQFKILEIISTKSWKQGPIDAGMYLKQHGFQKEFAFLKTNKYTEAARQACENALMEISETKLDFTDIFLDATKSNIFFIKFHMDKTGKIEWQSSAHKNGPQKRLIFRSKNFVGRKNGDKLGLQV